MVTVYLQMATVSLRTLLAGTFTPHKMRISLKQIRNDRLKNIYKFRNVVTHGNESRDVFTGGNPSVFNNVPFRFDFKKIHDRSFPLKSQSLQFLEIFVPDQFLFVDLQVFSKITDIACQVSRTKFFAFDIS